MCEFTSNLILCEFANNMHIKDRATEFGCDIIKLVGELPKNTVGYTIGNQVIRSGTAIGAILTEAGSGTSYNDFVHLLRTARKEARETRYWLKVIVQSSVLPAVGIDPLIARCDEIERILTSSIKTAETRQGDHKIKRKK